MQIALHNLFWTNLLLSVFVCAEIAAVRADETGKVITWSLREEFLTGAARANPNTDREGQPVWHFLRTTRSEGPTLWNDKS